jgi:tetratricopeptide (TPR) repeat protein
VRSAAQEAVARAAGDKRPVLRVVRGERKDKRKAQSATRRPRLPREEIRPAVTPRTAREAARIQDALVRAGRALDRGYEREAVRILRPLRDTHPDAPEVRELLGLAFYRLGRWAQAQKELEAFIALTASTEQHPVLMDCLRALGRHRRVEEFWEELRAASPASDVVTEGRIVAAGSLADRGRIPEAIKLLERGPVTPKRVAEHHLRLWYALADLHERAGDLPGARSLFRKVSARDPAFFDVAERLAALS